MILSSVIRDLVNKNPELKQNKIDSLLCKGKNIEDELTVE